MLNLVINLRNKLILCYLIFITFPVEAFDVIKHDITQSIEITANSLEIFEKEQRAVFEGNVRTSQGELNIYADKMEAMLSKNASKFTFETISYFGNIKIIVSGYEMTGKEACLDLVKQKLLVNGNLIIKRGQDQVKGDSLVYDLEKGLIDIRGGQTNKAKVVVQIE